MPGSLDPHRPLNDFPNDPHINSPIKKLGFQHPSRTPSCVRFVKNPAFRRFEQFFRRLRINPTGIFFNRPFVVFKIFHVMIKTTRVVKFQKSLTNFYKKWKKSKNSPNFLLKKRFHHFHFVDQLLDFAAQLVPNRVEKVPHESVERRSQRIVGRQHIRF